MKNILITGFFGEGNLGDEAILKAICENLPKDIIPIITSNKKHSYGIAIKRKGLLSLPSFLKAAYNSPITIFTGGILQDWSWEGVTFFAHRIILTAKMGSIPVLFGAGIGPLRSEKARKLVTKALRFVKIAYVRDKSSYDLYKSLLPNADVRLGTDWTWHFPIDKIKTNSNQALGINLRQWKDKSLLNKAIEIINNLNHKKIGLLARKGDIKEFERVANLQNIKNPTDFTGFANECKKLTCGIAMRYHAALAMVRSGLPTKLICYDDKVKNLAESIGMSVDNGITEGFYVAPDEFFSNNELLYKKMRESFLTFILTAINKEKVCV